MRTFGVTASRHQFCLWRDGSRRNDVECTVLGVVFGVATGRTLDYPSKRRNEDIHSIEYHHNIIGAVCIDPEF
jgi:hypothetical protein